MGSWASSATVSAVLDATSSAKQAVRTAFFGQMMAGSFGGNDHDGGTAAGGPAETVAPTEPERKSGGKVEPKAAADSAAAGGFEELELGGWRWEALAGGEALGGQPDGLLEPPTAAQMVAAAGRKGNKAFPVSSRNVSLEALYFVEQRKRSEAGPHARHVPSPEKYRHDMSPEKIPRWKQPKCAD